MTKKRILLNLLNINQLVDDRVTQALERLEQIDDLAQWYEGFDPIPILHELASHQLKQSIDASATHHYNDQDYQAFTRLWYSLEAQDQRQLLCEIAVLPDPNRIKEDVT